MRYVQLGKLRVLVRQHLVKTVRLCGCGIRGAMFRNTSINNRHIVASILLVDESRVNLWMMRYIIRQEGHTIYMAENGLEGLHCLEEHHIDLVITETNMQLMDGFEFIQHVRKNPRFYRLQILMITNAGDDLVVQRAQQSSVNGFLTHPLNSRQLNAVVKRTLVNRFQTRPLGSRVVSDLWLQDLSINELPAS